MEVKDVVKLLRESLTQLNSDASATQFEGGTFPTWKWKTRLILINGLREKALLLVNEFDMATSCLPLPDTIIDPGYQEGMFMRRFEQQLPNVRATLENIIWQLETFGGPYVPSGEQGIPEAFISHGKESAALDRLERFLRELGIEPLIVKDKASLDKDVDVKVNHYLSQAAFVVILATGDDTIDGKLHPRQNVLHETGLAQKTHGGKIIYLLEEKTEFPSNISPKVWERFNQGNMENVFLRIVIELKALGILKAIKPQK